VVEIGSERLAGSLEVGQIEAITGTWAVDGALNEAGLFQGFKVLRYCGLGEGQDVDDLAAYAALPLRQHTEHGHSGRMGKGLRPGRQLDIAGREQLLFALCHYPFV
jgi:hypothetical protein